MIGDDFFDQGDGEFFVVVCEIEGGYDDVVFEVFEVVFVVEGFQCVVCVVFECVEECFEVEFF